MTVTAFTISFKIEAEIISLGATKLSSTINLESLKIEEGEYDIVINKIYIKDEDVLKFIKD